MSTSTSSTTPQGLGECVVCGKEASTRCSKCSKAGIDWMYFCSQEHQKLIYFAHGRVCGTNPFKWPYFSEKEVKNWNRLIREPLLSSSKINASEAGVAESKLEYDLRTKSGFTMAELEAEYERGAIAMSRPHLDEATTQQLVNSRSLLYTLTTTTEIKSAREITREYVASSVARRPFDYMAYLEAHTIGLSRVEPQYRQSFSLLQHRLVVLIALATLIHREEHGTEGKRAKVEHFGWSIEVLFHLIETGQVTTPTGESAVIEEKLLPMLLEEFGFC